MVLLRSQLKARQICLFFNCLVIRCTAPAKIDHLNTYQTSPVFRWSLYLWFNKLGVHIELKTARNQLLNPGKPSPTLAA